MVCGAIVTAVAIEMIVARPVGAIHAPVALIAAAGPSIFLLGSTIFHRTMAQRGCRCPMSSPSRRWSAGACLP